MFFDHEFNKLARAQNERRKQQDFDDLQHELAGDEVGRIARFLSAETREAIRTAKGEGKNNHRLSALELLLLTDPVFARLYTQTMDRLTEAEATAERALADQVLRRDAARDALQRTLELAGTLPDGTRIFRNADGDVLDEEGQEVAPALAERVEWRGHEPSYETYREQVEAVERENGAVTDVRRDQAELGEIRAELTDQDEPPSKERLEELQDRLSEIHARYQSSPEPTPAETISGFTTTKPIL